MKTKWNEVVASSVDVCRCLTSTIHKKFILYLVCVLAVAVGCEKREDNDSAQRQTYPASPRSDRPAPQRDATSRPAGIPQGAEPVVAMVHFRPYKGFIDTPIVPSDLANKSLIAKLGELLEDPKYDIENLKRDCLSGRIGLSPMGLDILRKEGVKESDIEMLDVARQRRIAELQKEIGDRKRLDDAVRSLGVIVQPPKGWQEPFVIGEKKPFLSQLVMEQKRFSPIHHMVWIDSKHESTQGEIEVVVFAAGGFPTGVIAISPERWIRTDGLLSTYKLDDGEDVVAAPVQFKHNRGYKVRSIFESSDLLDRKKDRLVEDAVYFSSDRAFVAIRLRSRQDKFEDMENGVFRPFLDSVLLQTSATEQK